MSAPVYNVSVDGNSNETDLVIQSAGASIVEHDNHDHTLVNKNSADIGKLESAVYGPPEFVKLNEKIKSIKPGVRNAISGDGKTIAIRILDKSSINSISAIIEIRSEDSSKDATLDLGELPLENGSLFGSDVREIYFDNDGNTLILGDSAGALTDGNTGQSYYAGRVIIFSFDSVLKQWKNTLNYIGTNPNVTNNTFLSVGWSVSMSGDGKTAVAFSVDFTEPYPGIDQNDLRIWKNINNEWVLQVVEQPVTGLIGFQGCVAIDKQGENIVLFNRSTEVMYIFSPVNDVWKVKYSESFSNLFTGDSNPWLSYLGRIPPTIVTMEDHYRILCGIGEDYMYVFQLLKSASSGPVSAFTKIPHLGYSAQMSANSERLAIGELGYGNYRGRTTVYNLTYDKGIIVSNLIYRIDGEIGNQIVNDLGGLLSTESGYMVSIDNEGKRMVANSKYKPSSNVQQVYLIDEPKLDKVYKTLLQSTQLNEKTLVVHEGLVTKNIADIADLEKKTEHEIKTINPVLNKNNFNYFQVGQDLDPLPIGGAKYEEAMKLYKTTGNVKQLLQYGFCTKISDDGNTILVQSGFGELLDEVLDNERGINVYKWDDTSSMWLQKGQKIDKTFVGLAGKNAAGEDVDISYSHGWLSVLSGDGNTICAASTWNKLTTVNPKDNTRLYFFKYDETTDKWVAKGETYLEPERYTPYYSQGWNLRISFDGNKVLNSADYGLRDNITDPGSQGGYNELLAYNSTTNKWEIEHLFIGYEVPNLANDLGINENQITVVNNAEVGGIGPGVDANIETIVICVGYYTHYIYKKIDDLWTKTYTSSYKGVYPYGDLNSNGTKALIITGVAGSSALCDVVNWNSSTNSWDQEQTINLGSISFTMQAYITDNNLIVYSDKTNGTLKTWKYDENTKQWNLLTTKQVRETGYDGLQKSWYRGGFNTFKPSRNGKRVIIGFPFNTNPNGQINGHARVFELEDKSNLTINTNVIADEIYAKKNIYIDNALGVRGNAHVFGDLFLGSTATTSLTRKIAQLDDALANILTLQNQVEALFIEKPTLAEYLTQNVPFIVEFIAQNDAKFLTSIIGAKNYTFLLPNITENEFNVLVQSSNPQYVISVLKSHLLLDYIFDRESDYGLHNLLNDFDFRLWNNISASIQNRNSSLQIDLSSNGFKIITSDEKIETNTENILEKNILTTNNIIQKIDKILLPQKSKLEIIQTYSPEFYQLIIDNNLQNDFNNAETVICLAEGIADVIDSSFVAQLTANNITVADYMKLYCLTTFEKVDTWVSKLTYNTPLDDDNLEWLSGEPLPIVSDLSGIDAKYGLNVYGEIAYCYRDQSIINANYTNNNDGTYTYNTTGKIVNYREMFWRPPLGRQAGLLATDGIVHFTTRIIKPDIVRTSGVEPWME